ncbi:MAG: riboflavin synthase, partial [Candidatus Firestonebacteria bacterium]|nr:riboflavin synthase [Candidatus Firestonebacteria bacterium]
MFTGIIEEVGNIKSVTSKGGNSFLKIAAKKVLEGTKLGASIAVNGVCLTVVELNDSDFQAEATRETLERSSLKKLVSGSRVNLERALKADGRFDGHIVMGHVDATGVIKSLKQ